MTAGLWTPPCHPAGEGKGMHGKGGNSLKGRKYYALHPSAGKWNASEGRKKNRNERLRSFLLFPPVP